VISKKYGLQIKAESADNFEIFSSLRHLAGYIAQHRAT
jgi:acyl carrier protein